MNVLALVTARGGSKGFPRKNLAMLGDRPLVGWSHALLSRFQSNHPGEVRLFLSTDDAEIARAWPEADAPGRLRPAFLASDTASSMDVVDYEFQQSDLDGFKADALLLVQPTSPLLALEDLEAAWTAYTNGASCVVGMAAVDHPVQWTWRRTSEGILSALLDSSNTSRRQDLGEGYRPVGFYLAARSFLETHRSFFVDGFTSSVLVPSERAIDIDRISDLWMAEGVLYHTKDYYEARPIFTQENFLG